MATSQRVPGDGWLEQFRNGIRTPGGRQVIVAVAALAAFGLVFITVEATVGWDDEEQAVYRQYNDALVDGDLDLAWSLGCGEDRRSISRDSFKRLYDDAVDELGGELVRWSRPRGGAEWSGSASTVRRLPEIENVDGHYCVRLGENPLGTKF